MPTLTVRTARAPQAPRGLPLRAAAAKFDIDHRWIWLWAGQGLVGHVEVESADGRHKTYYVVADIERQVELVASGKLPYPAWFDLMTTEIEHRLGSQRLA